MGEQLVAQPEQHVAPDGAGPQGLLVAGPQGRQIDEGEEAGIAQQGAVVGVGHGGVDHPGDQRRRQEVRGRAGDHADEGDGDVGPLAGQKRGQGPGGRSQGLALAAVLGGLEGVVHHAAS